LIELDRLAGELDSDNRFAITCEIRKSSNQKLAAVIGSDNYIVSSNITSLLATQVSENRDLKIVFDEAQRGSRLVDNEMPAWLPMGGCAFSCRACVVVF
jgi:hypothetical protein